MNCQSQHFLGSDPRAVSRRWFLRDCGIGLGAMAVAELLGTGRAQASPGDDPLALKTPPSPAKAKHVIYLFMGGGPSQQELLDYKPKLAELDGTLPPPELLEDYHTAFINPNSKLLGPKFPFTKCGECGTELSSVLPHLAEVVDDIAVIRSMHTDAFNHAPAQIFMSTGSQRFGRPSFGAWTLYGLGSETRNLPGFVVLQSGAKGPSGGNANWGSGFLPTVYQGVPFRSEGDPVLYLSNPRGVDDVLQRETIESINRLNEMRLDVMGDPEISTRISSFEMAYRMQSSAPELMELADETQETLDLYGVEPGKSGFAANCLLARRMIERGVRFVELFHESWDQHGNLVGGIKKNCADTDRAAAALVLDLKRRGLLEDTIVVWGGEFGRTPMVQGGGGNGRDHHPNAFSMWLAGGGIKPGITLGASDPLGFNVAEDPVHVHDLHATLLHLLGFDHKQFTYHFQGRDFRLTDVAGRVVDKLLA